MAKFFGNKPIFALKKHYIRIVFLFLLLTISFLLKTNTFATNYSASITTNGEVIINGSGNISTSITPDNLNITTNCRAGYNLTLSTSTSDNNLYLGGDSTINSEDSFFSPVDGLSSLSSTTNSWGYLLSNNTPSSSSVFLAVPNSSSEPAVLKSTSSTASESDINDSFSVYYGASISHTLNPGTYKMIQDSNHVDGTLVYTLTIDTSCADSTVVSFNENLDGSGSEGTDSTIANFPTTSDNTTDTTSGTITLSNKRPTRTGYIFKEWNTEADGTGDYYYVGETVPMSADGLSGFVTLYAIWVANCPADTICYNDNHADGGTMTDQSATSNANNVLTASNFDRSGYGFAGWNTEADGTGTNYGPNQTINPGNLSTTGLTLFAHWLKPSGSLQTWANASSMNTGDMIALKDNRDNEVYAVAKLADGNIWTVENLRLNLSTANITANNTNNPTSTFLADAPSTNPTSSQCSSDSVACDDQIYYYAGNMNRSATQSPTGNTTANAWYSYGTMYNWYTATAGHGSYNSTTTSGPNSDGTMAGDICPAGWHLPTGGSSGEYNAFTTAIGGTGSTGATNIRKYPNNFIYSGDYNPKNNYPDGRGTQGRLWQSTASSNSNAYRMGYNNNSITPVNTYNKWDNFSVRCIYQGGNIPFYDVTVNFAGTGITSVTFENSSYPTETATPNNPTIEIAENTTYTITAATSSGYEFSSWATSSTGTLGSTSTNPTSFTITDETTLTATGAEIPTYEVTVNLGQHVNSVSFTNSNYGTQQVTTSTSTVNLRRGVEYILSSSYETGYNVDAWTTTANGTLGSTTSASTTYTVTGTATLSLTAQEADELSYTLVYNAGDGTDAPNSDEVTSYDSSYSFTITNSAPINYGYTFTGWTETNGGNTVDYTSGDTLTVTSTGAETTKTLYAVYTANSCPSGKICYYDNGADVNGGGRGTMANQSASSNSSATLIPSNYSKSGYGFAGWATDANATPYGPNATITTPDISSTGLALYAKWVAPTGNLQSWNSCNTLTQNSVIALTDTRDNNVYAVAKLADGKCWTIESLRLVPNTATITSQNTHNPASGFAAAAANSSSSNALCNTDDDSSCVNQLQYNTNSLNRSLTQSYNGTGSSVAWYSYGVYYNWYTATAGQGTFSTSANTNVSGDLCPKNWHLPTSTSSGEWAALNTAANGGVSNADVGLRTYPVNLIWSGDYNGSSRTSGYSNGRYWSSTSYDSNNAYRMGHQESGSKGSTPSGNYRKWDGFAIRCIRDEGTVEYSDVVVTFPANVTSVSFTNANYGVQIATPQNTTISLAQGATYTLTATFASGYTLDSWANGTNSTIGSTTDNPTTFSITDDSTLALTATTLACNPSATTIGAAVCLQDMNINIINSMADSTTYQLYDVRDWQQYSIAKLADNNVWMTESLNIAGGTALSSTDTDFDSSYTLPTTDGWTVVDGKLVLPASATKNSNNNNLTDIAQFDTNNHAYVFNSGKKTNCAGSSQNSPCYSYYSWDVATLGSGRSISTINTDANYSICPKNWKLPNTRYSTTTIWQTESDLYKLAHQYGLESTARNYDWEHGYFYVQAGPNTTPNFLLTGSYSGGMFNNNTLGFYWSSTSTNSSDHADALLFDSSSISTGFSVDRREGLSVRCLANYPTHPVTISPDSHISTVTFSASGEITQTATSTNPTVSLKEGISYTITAAATTGYELASWSTTANGALGSTTTNPTTYTITNTATLTVTSQAIPTYTVTVNMDSNVTGITFANTNYGTQSVTTTGSTVTLRRGITYNITSSYNTGAKIDTWSTTANGQLGSATSASTTYSVTGTATLSLSSVFLSPPASCNTPISGITYMQDITSSNYNIIMNSLTTNTAYYLRDSRDGEPYCVSKLADGNLWMLDNLRLDLTDATVKSNLSSSTTNASDTTLNYLKNGGGTASDKYAIRGVEEWSLSQYVSSYSYSDPLIVTGGECDEDGDNASINNCSYLDEYEWTKDTVTSERTYDGNGSQKMGIFYNYCATSAGSYCFGSGDDTPGTSIGNALEDICPANWRLPTGGDYGEQQALATAITGTTGNIIYSNSYNFVEMTSINYPGLIASGSIAMLGKSAAFQTSTRSDNEYMEAMYATIPNISNQIAISFSDYATDRVEGYMVRCIASHP